MKNKKRFIFGMVLILLIFSMGVFWQKSINRNVKLSKDDVMSLTEAEQIEVGKNSKITSATIIQRKTGTGPWDDNDDVGNDTSEDNDIVRSFDQVTYTVEYTMGLKDGATVENYKGGAIEVKAELPEACANVVKWDADSMAWMENATVSRDGRTITGKYTMSSTEITVPGKQTLVFVLKVLGASNGLVVQPTFTSNLLGNDESEKVSIQNSVVTVSAAPNYNVRISRNEELSNKTTVDYGNGDTSGRMYGYGILLELYNQSQDKGLKGIEYPKGDITFDVNLKLERSGFETNELEEITDKCTPILWNYGINNLPANPLISGRNMWTNGNGYFVYQSNFPLGVPRTDRTYTVKNSGKWKMTQNGSKIAVTVSNYELDGIFPIYNYNHEGAIRDQKVYNDNEGIFSVGYFQIFVPDNEESTVENRNYYLTVSERNMEVTSNSGIKTQTQMKTNDDEVRVQHVIYKKGSYTQYTEFRTLNGSSLESNWGRGDAKATIGSEFVLCSKFAMSLNNDYNVYGASKFIKFDGNFVEPELQENGEKYRTYSYGGTMKFSVWYVTKPDGTNWTSQSEMNNGNIEDMNLYENISDIPEGYVCVGMFFESAGGYLAVATGDNNIIGVTVKVKDTAKVGQTYGFTCRTKFWKDELDRNIYTITNKGVTYPQVEWDSGNLQYVKTEYDKNGVMIAGTHKGGYVYGNTVLVIGAVLNITSKSIDESGNAKVNYDLGKNEYDVKYKLQPSLVNANLKTSITGVNLKIEETLPVGMTYVPGSCEYDEPEITKNSDGTTLLVWYKYNCTVGEKIEPIVYKAHISEETANGVQYQTKTVVEEIIGEGEVYKVGNSRIADRTYTTAINVINLSNYSVYKTTTTPMIELNGQIHYKVTFLNKTEDTVNDFQMLDILPYSGDSRGSSFAGTYTVEKIDIKQTKSDETISNDNLKLYVTNSESVRTGVTVKDENLGTSSIWTQATSGQAINQTNTAYAITGPIAGKTRLEVDIYLKTTGNKAEDVYKNTATVQTNKSTEAMQTSIITVQDIKRELSGKVWFDSNADGLMNNNEQMLEGVKLKLVNEDGSTAIDIDGNEIQPVLTDKNGYYEFENMVKGNYKVQVEVTDAEKEITLKGVGVNREINSNFNSDGATDVITSLNSAESPVLSEKNVNAGIKYKNTTVLVHHYIKGTTTKLSEDVTVNGKIYDEYTTNVASDIPEQYELVETPTNATGIMTKNQIVVTYYYQLKNYPYTVNYLEKDTNKVLHIAKQGDELVYGSIVTSSNEVIDIDGYNYDSVDKDTLTIGIKDNVINIYYTKRNDLSYTVNYLEKTTNKVLHEQKTQDGMTFEAEVKASDEVIAINGYNYDSADKTSIKITTGENVINIYYTKRNDLSYKVNYLEKDTNKVLHDQKTQDGMVFESVVTSANEVIAIDGYNYDSVDKDSLIITTGENVINIYYTKRTDLSYTVNYLEKTSNKVLHNAKKVENKTFEDIIKSVDEKISIDGYNYDSVDKKSLTITTGANIINIYYTKRNDLSYKVNYLEKTTNNVLHNQKVQDGMTFEDVVTSADEVIDIDGYKYDSVDKTSIKITTGENVINIYYTKVNGLSYTVNYLEKGTNEVINPAKTKDGMTFQDVVTSRDEVIAIDGYNYNSVDKETLTIGTKENVINIYYTKRTDLSYKVNYLEKETNKVLHDQKVQDGMTFESVVTSANEVIDIDGYNYDSVDKATLTIGTEENVINIYYTKRTDLSYKVNYLEKDTNKVLYDQKVQNGMTFESIVNSSDEVIDIYGYNYDSVDKDTLTITTGENVINIYYAKKDTKVTVHYYEEGTTNKVSEDVEIPGKVFDNYETESASDIPSKYELVAEPKNQKGTMTEDEITVIYYYRKKVTQVIVHYYEENTTKKLSEDVTINGRVDDKYTTISATDVPIKYELIETPSNANGSMAESTIEVIYYYRVKDAVVHVRYLEKGTDIILADPDKIDGKVDEDYQTKAKEIDGYQLVEHTGNEKGKFEVEPLTITYYYLYKTKATVQYIDKITGQILEQSTTEGLEGDDFVTESKDFENYVLVEEPPEKTVKMTKEEQTLKYYYIHVSGGVIEKHIDVISGQILANKTYEGNEGDAYDIPSRTFDGYDLVEDRLPSNAKGTMKVEPVEVIYYYIYRSKVTAEYIDKNTGNKLIDDVVQKGHEGDNYTTERKTFDDYKLVEVPSNSDGSMTKEDIKVTYYYVHISGGVIVNHIDIKNGKQLLDETKEEGYEGDPYETHEENIPEYDLVKEKYPENATGKMTIEPTKVTYYYIKKTEVNVKYVDKVTGEEIDEPTNILGHEGDDYTTEPKDVPGYDLVEEPENKDGTMTADPIDVIYYYKRPAKVIVNYYDIDTKEKLADEIEITGHQNDDYTTEQKDIKYYEIAKVPENKEGKMVVTVTKDENGKDIVDDTTYVNYYYRKLIFNLRVDKTITSVIVNGQETPINGNLGKVEVHRKNISTANIKVVYKIKVTNDSELTGKANVVENIPSGMTMIADNNPGWTINETTASVETDEIKPGESREYQIVLGWQNGDNNIGTKENVASIITENEAGFDEKDKSDNESKADLIVAVGTGEVPYVAIAGSILLIMISITAGIYVIKKKHE